MIKFLYKKEFNSMYDYALRHTGDRELAFDVVQDTFVWAIKKENDLTKSKYPKGWLFNTLKNVIGNNYQKKQRYTTVELNENTAFTYDRPCPVYELLPHNLDNSNKKLLILRYEKCYSYCDLSNVLNITETTCRKRHSRALNLCRKKLQKTS